MHNLVQTKLVAFIIGQTVMSDTNFAVQIAGAKANLVDGAFEEHHLCKLDGASTTTPGTKASNDHLSLRPTRSSNAPSDYDTEGESRKTRRGHHASSCCKICDRSRSLGRNFRSDVEPDKFFDCRNCLERKASDMRHHGHCSSSK